jgi:hypothetical protein
MARWKCCRDRSGNDASGAILAAWPAADRSTQVTAMEIAILTAIGKFG